MKDGPVGAAFVPPPVEAAEVGPERPAAVGGVHGEGLLDGQRVREPPYRPWDPGRAPRRSRRPTPLATMSWTAAHRSRLRTHSAPSSASGTRSRRARAPPVSASRGSGRRSRCARRHFSTTSRRFLHACRRSATVWGIGGGGTDRSPPGRARSAPAPSAERGSVCNDAADPLDERPSWAPSVGADEAGHGRVNRDRATMPWAGAEYSGRAPAPTKHHSPDRGAFSVARRADVDFVGIDVDALDTHPGRREQQPGPPRQRHLHASTVRTACRSIEPSTTCRRSIGSPRGFPRVQPRPSQRRAPRLLRHRP